MTKILYWEKPYQKQFAAKLLDIKNNTLILDKTAFFPTSGNQIHDTGIISVDGKTYEVINVEKQNDEILHTVKPKPSKEIIGKTVKGKIDWERRYNIMKAHTSQHIFSAIMLKKYNIATIHANIKSGEVTIEFEIVSRDQLESVIKEINILFTFHNHKMVSHILDYESAKKGFADKIRGIVPEVEIVRVLEVENIDRNTCGGTHVKNTTEIGPIVLIKIYQDREITYYCGQKAIEYVSRLNFGAIRIAQSLGCSVEEFEQVFTNKFGKLSKSAKNETKLGHRVMELLPFTPGIDIEGIMFRYLEDPIDKKTIMNSFDLFGQNSLLVARLDEKLYIVLSSSSKIPADKFVQYLCDKFDGRGGGNSHNAQGKLDKEPKDFKIEITDFINDKTNHG